MARRFAPLSQRQVEVLRWVAEGCPDGEREDFAYKRTAYALADRGLVTVDRRRHAWRVTITEDGRYYLEHGAYRPVETPGSRQAAPRKTQTAKATPPPTKAPVVAPESLLAELEAASGVLAIPNPPESVRGAYRRAISKAITDSLVPDGYGLRHTGRARGDLVVRLVNLDEEPAWAEPLPAIPIPGTLHGCYETVSALRDTPSFLDVSAGVRQRALLIVQAIADECARRGYELGLRDDGGASFQITVGEERFRFTLSEEFERREVIDSEKLAVAKYAWQRIPSSVRQEPSGRLVLRLGSGYGSVFWADRKRWSLEHRLPKMFQEIAGRAAAQAEARSRREEQRRQQRRTWEESIPRAKQAYIDQLNRDRLCEQVAKSAEAAAIREYCARLDSLVEGCADPELAEQIRKWVGWAREQADRVDPLEDSDRLTYVVPSEVRPSDFDPFMPRGLSAWHPPD